MSQGLFLIVLAAAFTFATAGSLHADRPSERPTEWTELESELEKAGIETDTASLITAARKSTAPSIRWFAVELLGRRREVAAIPDLRAVRAIEKDPIVRQAAILALARMKDPGAEEELVALLNSVNDPERAVYLASRLAELGNFVGYKEIVRAARSKDQHLRFLSAAGLVRFSIAGFSADSLAADERPIEILKSLLNGESPEVRREAVLQAALGESRGFQVESLVPTIERLAKLDPDVDVRAEANQFLTLRETSEPR